MAQPRQDKEILKQPSVATANLSPGGLTGWRRWVGPVLLVIGGLSLLCALSATWLSTVVFNQKNFVETTETVLSTPDSRQAIAGVIVERAFQNRPVITRLAGNQATSLISGMLGSDLVGTLYSHVINSTYAYLTSPQQNDIAIDLTTIKTPLSGIVSFAENRGQAIQFDPATIPDEIMLINAEAAPDFYRVVQLVLVFNAVFWIIAAAAFAWYIFLQKGGYVKRIYTVCITVAVIAILGLFTGPFTPPAIASFVDIVGIRDIVINLTSAFLQPFATQLWITLGVAALVAFVVSLRYRLQKVYFSLIKKLQ